MKDNKKPYRPYREQEEFIPKPIRKEENNRKLKDKTDSYMEAGQIPVSELRNINSLFIQNKEGRFNFIPVKEEQVIQEGERSINGYTLNSLDYSKYRDYCEEYDIDFEEAFFTKVEDINEFGIYGIRGRKYTMRIISNHYFNLESLPILQIYSAFPHMGTIVSSTRSFGDANWSVDDLFPLATGKKAIEFVKKQKKEEEDKLRELTIKRRENSLKLIEPLNLQPLDYLTKVITKTNIESNFIERGVYIEESGKFINYKSYGNANCCDFFKESTETDDYMIYIPLDWTNILGYDERFIKKWINFINEVGLGDIIYLGKSSYEDHRECLMNNYGSYVILNNSYHKILIKTVESPYISYLRFIMIRYLYLSSYNNIPYLSMYLKDNITELTNWQAIMIASGMSMTTGYYGLINNFKGNLSSYVDAFPLIFDCHNNIDIVTYKLLETKEVNNSFEYSQVNLTFFKDLIYLLKLGNFSIFVDKLKALTKQS